METRRVFVMDKEVYKIKSIKNFKNQGIGKRKKWIGLKIHLEHLTVGDIAIFVYYDEAGAIYTSGVEHIQNIEGGYLIATYSGTVYELERVI